MDIEFLKQALRHALPFRGQCAPNPSVGAVIAKDGQVLATGAHQGAGNAHAEIEALNQLGGRASGASLYVTLEPCCHYGRTPPCTDAVLKSGITKVVYGYQDPNPKVGGKGAALLHEAGITCYHVALPCITRFYESYTLWLNTQRPWVTAKLALSLDGKIAGPGGAPVSITGEDARIFTHEQRQQADAILTTAKTIQQDDPQLNVRLGKNSKAKPVYILDRALGLRHNAHIFQTAKEVVIFHGPQVQSEKLNHFKAQGIQCIEVPCEHQRLDLFAVLSEIGKLGCHDLWVEAGGTCFQSLSQQGLINKAYLYMATKTLGNNAVTAFTGQENVFVNAKEIKWDTLGNDALCEIVF